MLVNRVSYCKFNGNSSLCTCEDLQSLSKGGLVYHGDELERSRLKQMTALPEEMVPAWLSMEDTVVKRAEQSTWSSLADALKRNGQADIANNIIQDRVEMESRQG